jgi:uncharacterized membrane protein YhhN
MLLNILIVFVSSTLAGYLDTFALIVSAPLCFIAVRDALKVNDSNSFYVTGITFLAYIIVLYELLMKIFR